MSWHDRGVVKAPVVDKKNAGRVVRPSDGQGAVQDKVLRISDETDDGRAHGFLASFVVRGVAWLRENSFGGGRGTIGGGQSREAVRKSKRKFRRGI